MRRGAVNAVKGLALMALALATSGCGGGRAFHRASPRAAMSSAWQSAQCQDLSRKAQAAIDRHDDAAAVALLQTLVALEPRSAEAHHRLGNVLQARGRNAEAETQYDRALELDHEYVGAMTGLGVVAEARGRPVEALERFDTAIEIAPNQSEAHLRRGRALEALGRTEEALAAYFRTLEFAPNSAEARLRVATLQLAGGMPDQALARLDALVVQAPENAEARHQRGRAQLALKHLPQALDDLRFAAAHLPDRPDVHYHLALALDAAHKTQAALTAAERALKLAPDYAEARALTQKLRR